MRLGSQERRSSLEKNCLTVAEEKRIKVQVNKQHEGRQVDEKVMTRDGVVGWSMP